MNSRNNSDSKITPNDLLMNWYKWRRKSTNRKKLSTIHAAIYFYIWDLGNQLESFYDIPIKASKIKRDLKIKNHAAYFQALNELMEIGFLQEVKTQNSFNPKNMSLEYSEDLAKEMDLINK